MTPDIEKVDASSTSHSSHRSQRIIHYARKHLQGEVDSKKCTSAMVYACFLTGFTSAVSFTACFIWCGFQTGNVAQLGVALARTFQPGAIRGFHMPDKQALCSLLSFLLGTSFGRVGDKMGSHTRKWLILATIVQALLLMASALTAHYVWVELVNDPFLFALRRVNTRDHKAMSILAVFLGAFISKALVDKIGSAGTLGIGAGLRFLGAWVWLWVPSQPPSKPS
ncbi:hypothetical protein QFC24_000375 [Naganishia onofrii]|uniref:Uncharacterized protein n=1 Tax=Naganishia onofrii TaxID=1851511 RepID=A0ACC2XXC5_9TREE|nr:hypothetical protein QFC24_000375 [Naganishia onofrii]